MSSIPHHTGVSPSHTASTSVGTPTEGLAHKRPVYTVAARPKSVWTKAWQAFVAALYTVIPPGGILSSAFNMASSSIGAGILGLPAATNSAGLVLAMIYLVVITFFSIFSMHILAIAAQKTNIRSFEGMARWLFPQRHYAFSYWAAAIRLFHAFAGCVAYIISIGNCFDPIFAAAHVKVPHNSAMKFLASKSGNRLITCLMWLCIVVPLVLPKHIDSLRYASTFAVSFMIYFVVVIVVHSCTNGLPENIHHVEVVNRHGDPDVGDNVFLFRRGNPVVQSVGVFVFAYVCQINAYEVWWDMRSEMRTTRNYMWAALIGMTICGTLYAMVCFFGYVDFGSAQLQNKSMLLMYRPLDNPAILLAYVGVLVKLCVAYALLTIAARNSIYYMIGFQEKYGTGKDNEALEPTGRIRTSEDAVNSNDINGVALDVGAAEQPVALCDAHCGTDAGRMPRKSSGAPTDKLHPMEAVVTVTVDYMASTAEDVTFIDRIPFWKHGLLVMLLSIASLLCGLFIPSINMVFGFAGAISGGFLAFIFPALYYMYAGGFSVQQEGWFNYAMTYLLLICGVVGIVFGTGGTIYSTLTG